jgi:signal transduction histidine kinase
MDDLLRRSLGEAVEIETIISGGLWTTYVDPTQVETALLNLAVNARDAMGGRGKLTIEAGNAWLDENYAAQHVEVKAGQYVMVAVSDTGHGMPAEVIERVFEPIARGSAKLVTNRSEPDSEYTHSACVILCLPGVPQRQRRLRHEPVRS